MANRRGPRFNHPNGDVPEAKSWVDGPAHRENYRRQMEDWLEFAWANCMKNTYFYRPRGTGAKSPRTIGIANRSTKRKERGDSRTQRRTASRDDNTSIDFSNLYRDWVQEVRDYKRATNPTQTGRPPEFDKNGRKISARVWVPRVEALHEFQLLWDFMTDQGIYPKGFSPTVMERRLRSRTIG